MLSRPRVSGGRRYRRRARGSRERVRERINETTSRLDAAARAHPGAAAVRGRCQAGRSRARALKGIPLASNQEAPQFDAEWARGTQREASRGGCSGKSARDAFRLGAAVAVTPRVRSAAHGTGTGRVHDARIARNAGISGGRGRGGHRRGNPRPSFALGALTRADIDCGCGLETADF